MMLATQGIALVAVLLASCSASASARVHNAGSGLASSVLSGSTKSVRGLYKDAGAASVVAAPHRELLGYFKPAVNISKGPPTTGLTWAITYTANFDSVKKKYAYTFVATGTRIVDGKPTTLTVDLAFTDLAEAQIAAFEHVGTGRRLSAMTEQAHSDEVAAMRLVAKETAKFAPPKPSGVSYGVGQTFELYSQVADYRAAVAFCAARSARLAGYANSETHAIVNTLCGDAVGQRCWVEVTSSLGALTSAAFDKCPAAVGGVAALQLGCSQRLPFVCVKKTVEKAEVAAAGQGLIDETAGKPRRRPSALLPGNNAALAAASAMAMP